MKNFIKLIVIKTFADKTNKLYNIFEVNKNKI